MRSVKGSEFIRRARRWARTNGLADRFLVEESRGKGGHQIVRVGERWTTVKAGEIGTGLLASMLRQLGIDKKEF
jgi:hypothetical protein